MNDWAVYRQDFSGNEFLVEKGLTEKRARELVVEYESHKHHQHYWADKEPAKTPDLVALAKQMISNGSSIEMVVPVLLTYNASKTQILDALLSLNRFDEASLKQTVDQAIKNRKTS